MKYPIKNTNTFQTLLVADSHPIIYYGLKAIFDKSEEFQIIGCVHNESELIKMLKETIPDILFLELNQSGTDIHRLLKQILVSYPSMRILAFTSYSYPELVQSVISLGVHGFLLKTALKEQIFNALKIINQGGQFMDKNISLVSDEFSNIEMITDSHKEGIVINKFKLTDRERDVLILLSRGLSTKKVAVTLHISEHTVESHKKNMFKKLKLKKVVDLIRFAIKNGYD